MKNLKKHILLFFAVLTVGVIGFYIFLISNRAGTGVPLLAAKSLPYLGKAPEFTLVEKSGQAFNKSQLNGKIWIGDFIFTRCQGQCPIMSQQMAQLAKALPGVTLVSFSVDPDFDKPAVLEEYSKTYSAGNPKWIFLTGDRDVLNHITTSFHMNTVDEPMFHSASFVLVDGEGNVRGYYDANDSDKMKELIDAVKKII